MDPRNNEAPIHLPPPVEQAPTAPNSAENRPLTGEAAGHEMAPQAPAAMPTVIPLPADPVVPRAAQAMVNQSASSNPMQASDDTDLIEKEWVTKAKAIVERTKDDPYKQSEELTVFKADYMKKRYNRTVKLSK